MSSSHAVEPPCERRTQGQSSAGIGMREVGRPRGDQVSTGCGRSIEDPPRITAWRRAANRSAPTIVGTPATPRPDVDARGRHADFEGSRDRAGIVELIEREIDDSEDQIRGAASARAPGARGRWSPSPPSSSSGLERLPDRLEVGAVLPASLRADFRWRLERRRKRRRRRRLVTTRATRETSMAAEASQLPGRRPTPTPDPDPDP